MLHLGPKASSHVWKNRPCHTGPNHINAAKDTLFRLRTPASNFTLLVCRRISFQRCRARETNGRI